MAESINWLFIVLGVAIGGPIGYWVEKARVWQHRTRHGMRLAMPAIKLAGMAALVLVVFVGCGLVWVGVL